MERISYQISSRAAILLGRESVSKVDGAIIELIKNTYDADASIGMISFDIENDTIWILDNGIGMTIDVIKNAWMMIGTNNKLINYKSSKNRIKSGEKGIGRFALDRLGNKCVMHTKHEDSDKTICWTTNWDNFEDPTKTINEVEATIEYHSNDIIDFLPDNFSNKLSQFNELNTNNFKTGTLLKITELRDKWTPKDINKIIEKLSYITPISENKDYKIVAQTAPEEDITVLENQMIDEYDYRMKAIFDGENFKISLERNEFDLNKIPEEVFNLPAFKDYPYRKQDFIDGDFDFYYSIKELMKNDVQDFIDMIKEIGPFEFHYSFLKVTATDDDKETFYYKDISNKRRLWLNQNSGIKIYRDNFIVRPYGDINTEAYDWLKLDARRAKNPASISHPTGNWSVRNLQGYGCIYISRVLNNCIIDKSSREGFIDNEYFSLFKEVITNIISIFEQDRQHIARELKAYKRQKYEEEKKKEEASRLAEAILEKDKINKNIKNKRKSKKNTKIITPTEAVHLAEAVKIFEDEKEELLSEIKLLRALATNGLITTSIIHDLKGLNAILAKRAESFEIALDLNNKDLIDRCLIDLKSNDDFLNAWIYVVITQLKKDKRKRIKADIYSIIKNIEDMLEPMISKKNITLEIEGEENTVYKKVFLIDIESIILNLIINSIDAFRKIDNTDRKIKIKVNSDDNNVIIHYFDNGPGISKVFKNPYDIFKFGATDKKEAITGEVIGTGLGMYIISSTVKEYNGECIILNNQPGFALDLVFSK